MLASRLLATTMLDRPQTAHLQVAAPERKPAARLNRYATSPAVRNPRTPFTSIIRVPGTAAIIQGFASHTLFQRARFNVRMASLDQTAFGEPGVVAYAFTRAIGSPAGGAYRINKATSAGPFGLVTTLTCSFNPSHGRFPASPIVPRD